MSGGQKRAQVSYRLALFSSAEEKVLFGRASIPGAVKCVSRGTIVLERFPDSGAAAAQQRAANQTVMAVATEPANSGSQSGVRSNHAPVTKWAERCFMRMQEPCAGSAAADHHEF